MSEVEVSSKQIDRILIIDESSFTSNLIRDIHRALLHFLLLADNSDPSYRTPRLGVSLLQGSGWHLAPSTLFPFQPLNKSTLVKLKSVLKQTNVNISNSTMPERESSHLNTMHWKDLITESIKSQLQCIITAHHDTSIGCELILTVITGRDRVWADKSLTHLNSISAIRNIIVRKIEVVCVDNLENSLQDSSMDINEYKLPNSNSKNSSISQSVTEPGLESELNMGTLSVMADEVSLLQYFKTWLTFQNNDSEDIVLHVGQLTLKCDIQDCILRTDWLPFQNSYYINEIQPQNESSKQCNTLRQKHISIELNSVSLIDEKGICESVLFGAPRLLKPTSFWKLDWEDLEKNQERFLALAQKLSERKQCLVVKQSSNMDVRGRRVPSGHFLVLPSTLSDTCMLIKPIVTSELVVEAGWEPTIMRSVDEFTQQEVSNSLDSLALHKEYNPLNHESGLYTCLELVYDKGKNYGSTQRSTGSVRNERGYIGAIPPRKSNSKGRKKIAFIQGVNSNEFGSRLLTGNQLQPRYNHNQSEDHYLSPNSDYSFD